MIEAGKYKARAVGPNDVQFGTSKNGNEQVAVLFAFTEDALLGQHITWIGAFAPGKATEITIKALRNCGWAGADLTDMSGIDSEEVELVVVEEADDKGNPRTRVQWVNKPGSGKIEFQSPLAGDGLKAFAARMKGTLLASLQGQQRTQAAPRTGQKPTGQASRAPAQPRAQPQQGGYDGFAEQYSGSGPDSDIPF